MKRLPLEEELKIWKEKMTADLAEQYIRALAECSQIDAQTQGAILVIADWLKEHVCKKDE
jgi:hypothetical protein